MDGGIAICSRGAANNSHPENRNKKKEKKEREVEEGKGSISSREVVGTGIIKRSLEMKAHHG